MEEIKLLEFLFQSVDFIYVIMCNVCTYAIIQVIKDCNLWKLTKSNKRITSAVIAFTLAVVMYGTWGHNPEALFYGFFLQFLTWDYLFKPFIQMMVNKLKKGEDE